VLLLVGLVGGVGLGWICSMGVGLMVGGGGFYRFCQRTWERPHSPFKQCTTTSSLPSASKASSSSVQILFESKAEKDFTWFSSAIVLTTWETYSISSDDDDDFAAFSCWMIESTCAMASWERRVPMLILVMFLLVLLVLLVGSVGEDGVAILAF